MFDRRLNRRSLLAGGLAVGGVSLAGCGSRGDGVAVSPSGQGTVSSAASSVDVASHEMTAPGPRRGGLVARADILVTSPSSLSPEQIDAVQALNGVVDVEAISLSDPVIENRALRVAAVDPARYRSFTTPAAADTDEVWQRVAAGELALRDGLRSKLPVSSAGFLRLGTVHDAPEIHVGAYTPQSPLIDAVVNPTWIPTLGMTPDNALLVRTGATAPQRVRGPLHRLLGDDVSVQMVDVAARLGIDPDATQIAVPTGSVADAVGVYRYTVLGGGRIAPDPGWVRDNIVSAPMPILGSIVCHKLMVPQLTAVFDDVLARGLGAAIKPSEYAGCYVPRFIAGSTTLSNHAYGLAVDINAIENQRGTAGEIDPGVVEIFDEWGFTWGGTWHYTDPMHFEVNTIVTPTSSSSARTSRPDRQALTSASRQVGTDR